MSLNPESSRRRGRSKSPGRERSRSRAGDYPPRVETIRAPSPPKAYPDMRMGYGDYGSGREGGLVSSYERPSVVTAEPRGAAGAYEYGGLDRYKGRSSPDRERAYAMPGALDDERQGRERGGGGGREYGAPVPPPQSSSKYIPESERFKYGSQSGGDYDARRYEDPSSRGRRVSFNASIGSHSISAAAGVSHDRPPYVQPPSPSHFQVPAGQGYPFPSPGYSGQGRKPDPLAYPDPEPPAGRQYADPAKWEYAKPGEAITYSKRPDLPYSPTGDYILPGGYGRPSSPPRGGYSQSSASISGAGSRGRHGSDAQYLSEPARTAQSKIVTVEPGSRRRETSPNPASLGSRMHSLSVSTSHLGGTALSLGTAPGSPLLEAYHGTYQSISPMPSPLMMASHGFGDVNYIEALSPESSDDERRGGKKMRKTARFHDPEEEATILAKALKGEKRAPDTAPLIEILPRLTHDQILDLRLEYKKIVKTGSEKKGVNIAKHIKLRLKDEDPSLMKACYACALGKWESEAYWSNFWYQGEKSRRELLIESLMGRTNREIRHIKDGFNDKKYGDSLVKCMRTELKEDKFKKAVLLVLEERKMEERRGEGVDRGLVEDDVRELNRAVRSEKGGETAMINIVVVRSERHLREVLRTYESVYRANFAREMLKKSGNLVGELLAHILNGVINKPVRDALLVNHALKLSKSDAIRTELLISRLLRYHWDRSHMEAVKREYRARYGVEMQQAVREGTRGEWGLFCEALCMRRMGDEVKEYVRDR